MPKSLPPPRRCKEKVLTQGQRIRKEPNAFAGTKPQQKQAQQTDRGILQKTVLLRFGEDLNINHQGPIAEAIRKPELCVQIKAINVAALLIGQAIPLTLAGLPTGAAGKIGKNRTTGVRRRCGQQWARRGQRSASHLRFVKEKLQEVFAEQLPGVRTAPEFSRGRGLIVPLLAPIAKRFGFGLCCSRECAVISTTFCWPIVRTWLFVGCSTQLGQLLLKSIRCDEEGPLSALY